jgi:hypothetical protein
VNQRRAETKNFSERVIRAILAVGRRRMGSNVISKNVYHDKLDVGEEERDEWVDEDDKEKRRQYTALGDPPTQRTRRGDVRRRVHNKKRAIREESTDP